MAADYSNHNLTGEAAVSAGEAPGMPQLDFASFPNQIFWLLITLVVIYLVLSRISLPRIGAVLAERQGAITNDIAAAEDLKQRAVDAEAAYDKALADARVQAGVIVTEARADIQGDLDAASARADAEISARAVESEKAISEIRLSAEQSIQDVANDTTSEILAAFGTKADKASVRAAVSARLKG